MAAGRTISQLLRKRPQLQSYASIASILVPSLAYNADQGRAEFAGIKSLRALAVIGAGVSGLFGFASVASADESEHGLQCPSYPWPHNGILDSDNASIRRGQKLFQEVCSSCHSFSLYSHQDLSGVAYADEDRTPATADIEVIEGPNDEGKAYVCPGKLCHPKYQPHQDEQERRYASGGTYASDLSFITEARRNGQNYVLTLLGGNRDLTAGVLIKEYVHHNPNFCGGLIAVPKILVNDALENEDSASGTMTQMWKDATAFLSWAAEPEMEERKLMGFKWIFVLSLVLLQAAYYRRLNRSALKSRKLILNVVN